MKTTKGKKFGKQNLLPERIDPKDERVRISLIMEGDLLDLLRARAKEAGTPYQTFMKEILRNALVRKELLQPTPKGYGLDLAVKMIEEMEQRLELKIGEVKHDVEDLKKQA